MKTNIKSGDLDKIRTAILGNREALRDKFFLGELFLKSGFDRATIKFNLSICENEIELVDEIIKSHKDRADFIPLLEALSNKLLSENEVDSAAISAIVEKYQSSETQLFSEKDERIKKEANPSLQLNTHIHSSIKSLFALGIQVKKYDGMTLEAFKILNDRLRQYCVKQGR